MRRILSIVVLLILAFLAANAQKAVLQNGWYPSGVRDTVLGLIAVTDTTTFHVVVIAGYLLREQYIYVGDRMPPGDYSPIWQNKQILDDKYRVLPTILIWMEKTK